MAIQITFAQYINGMPTEAYKQLLDLYRKNTGVMFAVNEESHQAIKDMTEEERLELAQDTPHYVEQ